MEREPSSVAVKLLSRLKSANPVKVSVVDSAGEERVVAVPDRRRKWGAVVDNIMSRPWTRCDFLSKGGASLGIFENEDAEPEDDEDDDQDDDRGRGVTIREERLLGLMLRAQELALNQREKSFETLMASMNDNVRATVDAARGLCALYEAQVKVATQSATLAAQGKDGIAGLLEALPELAEAAPMLMQAVAMMRNGGKLPVKAAAKVVDAASTTKPTNGVPS